MSKNNFLSPPRGPISEMNQKIELCLGEPKKTQLESNEHQNSHPDSISQETLTQISQKMDTFNALQHSDADILMKINH